MNENSNIVRLRQQGEIDDPLTNILWSGARRLLAQAVEMEAEAFLAAMKDLKLPDGRDRVVRHGHGPTREIQTGIGLGWRELLVEVKRRGLKIAPEIAVGDGALGFWKALDEIFPGTKHQRCWVHKTANVLNKVALSVQPGMKKDLREVWLSPNRATAEAAIDVFAEKYGAKYPKAVECLTKDRQTLLAFYDFPAEHWDHLRTSNPIESVFSTVRHRTVRTKGSLSSTTAKLMVFKLIMAASKTWRRLNGEKQLPKVIEVGESIIADARNLMDHGEAKHPVEPDVAWGSKPNGDRAIRA